MNIFIGLHSVPYCCDSVELVTEYHDTAMSYLEEDKEHKIEQWRIGGKRTYTWSWYQDPSKNYEYVKIEHQEVV